MSTFKNVALIGASGRVGKPALKALSEAGFNVTIVSREGGTSSFPSDAKVVFADYTSIDSLASAFSGIDAVVSAVGAPGLGSQPTYIEAAIKAGVKRYIPSEYGCDTLHEKTAKFPVFKGKVETSAFLKEKAEKGEIEYTILATGPFFDMMVDEATSMVLAGLDLKNEKVTSLYDGGKTPFSTSTLADVGKAIANILSHPSETANKQLFVYTATLTQLDVIGIVEKALDIKFDIPYTEASTAKLENEANEKLAKGDFSGMLNYLMRAIYAPEYGTDFTGKDSNRLLGVQVKSGAELQAFVKEFRGL